LERDYKAPCRLRSYAFNPGAGCCGYAAP